VPPVDLLQIVRLAVIPRNLAAVKSPAAKRHHAQRAARRLAVPSPSRQREINHSTFTPNEPIQAQRAFFVLPMK